MAPSGLRERKKVRTKRAIAVAALSLFEANGYDATSVDQIAETADVSRRTFFRYFRSKDEVALTEPERLARAFESALQSSVETELVPRIERALLAVARIINDERDLLLPAFRLARTEPQLRVRLIRLRSEWEVAMVAAFLGAAGPGLAQPASEGAPGAAAFRTPVSGASATRARRRARLAAAMTSGTFLAALENWAAERNPGPLESRVVEAFEVLRGGLDGVVNADE